MFTNVFNQNFFRPLIELTNTFINILFYTFYATKKTYFQITVLILYISAYYMQRKPS